MAHELQAVIAELGGTKALGRTLWTDHDLRTAIREGFPQTVVRSVMSSAGLTLAELAATLDLSPRSLQRRRHEGRLARHESDRLYRLARIVALAKRFRHAWAGIMTPIPVSMSNLVNDQYFEILLKSPGGAAGKGRVRIQMGLVNEDLCISGAPPDCGVKVAQLGDILGDVAGLAGDSRRRSGLTRRGLQGGGESDRADCETYRGQDGSG